MLARLNLEASTCVLLALARLSVPSSCLSTLSLALSSYLPTVFSSDSSDMERSYSLWLSLPLPSSNQLSSVRQSLDSDATTRPRSLKVTSGQAVHYFPVWIVGHWTCLQTLVGHCHSWERSIEWLEQQIATLRSDLAHDCLSMLSSLPLDCSVPTISPFSTSHLPTLLGNHWLTDNHINAGVDYINAHPGCNPRFRLLSSYFLSSLELNRQIQTTRSLRSHSAHLLKNLLANGRITQLLIPVHRPSHWVLLLVDIAAQTHTYMDSLCPEKYSAPSVCVQLINGWLSEALDTDICLSPVPGSLSLDWQTDSNSCGVAVMSTMAHIALGQEFEPWCQAASGEERTRWALRFVDGVSFWVSQHSTVALHALDNTSTQDMLAEKTQTEAYSEQCMDVDSVSDMGVPSNPDSPLPVSSDSIFFEESDCGQMSDVEMNSESVCTRNTDLISSSTSSPSY